MNQATYLIDASIFILELRGDKQTKKFLQKHAGEWAMSFVVWGELLQGVRRKEHRQHIDGIVVNTEVLWGSRNIEKLAIELLQKYVANGLGFYDALIAATALEHKLTLVTYNAKHFEIIKELKVERLK